MTQNALIRTVKIYKQLSQVLLVFLDDNGLVVEMLNVLRFTVLQKFMINYDIF